MTINLLACQENDSDVKFIISSENKKVGMKILSFADRSESDKNRSSVIRLIYIVQVV